jgi:apolipoprotein N-acyltransferase
LLTSRADVALAMVSGALFVLSFPKFGHPAFGWIALTPLLVALSGAALRRAFLLGLATGIIYFTGTLYWITGVMAVYGGLQTWVAVLINGALIAYLALFPALFALCMRRIVMAYGRPALLAAPIVWVAMEFGRAFITSFPWVLLGYSQVTVLPIAQLASLFGVYGLSMLVAAVSAALAFAAGDPASAFAAARLRRDRSAFARDGRRTDRKAGRYALYVPAAAVLAIVLLVAAWGSRRAAASEWTRAGDPIRIGLVQGNVDQSQKWDVTRASAIFKDYLNLTRQAIREGAQLVLWPESSTPFLFEENLPAAAMVRALAQQARVPIVFGSDQIERGRPDRYYNSAFLVRADGTTGGVYRKVHLVPFGEYVPFQRLLFFAAPLTEQSGTFSPGLNLELLPVDGHRLSVAICYEVVYPDLVRQFVAGGSELLTTITNDAWFGETSAPLQHFQQAAIRAIENGRYLVRSANTGISGIVDPYGRVLAQTPIFESAVVVGEARFLRTSTFFSRHGDVLAYASVVATLVLLVVANRRVQ